MVAVFDVGNTGILLGGSWFYMAVIWFYMVLYGFMVILYDAGLIFFLCRLGHILEDLMVDLMAFCWCDPWRLR